MQQYRLMIDPAYQIGFCFEIDLYAGPFIKIDLPFLKIFIGLDKRAKGALIFGRDF